MGCPIVVGVVRAVDSGDHDHSVFFVCRYRTSCSFLIEHSINRRRKANCVFREYVFIFCILSTRHRALRD